MLRHSLGGAVFFISLQHFIAPALDLMPCLQARGTRDCNKGIKTMSTGSGGGEIVQRESTGHQWFFIQNGGKFEHPII